MRLREGHFEVTETAMKQRLFLVFGATLASLSLLMFGAACERHSWEDTSEHHKPHGDHGEHADHAEHDGDHDKAEGDHGGADKKGGR